MSGQRRHQHEDQAGGPEDGGFDWFRILDILVWVSVAVIVILGTEWLVGYLVREKIARGADKMLAKVAAGNKPAEPTPGE